MRVERTYWLEHRGMGAEPETEPHFVQVEERTYCEDPACIEQHEDPAILWDTKTSYCLAEAYGRDRGQRIIEALRAEELAARKGHEFAQAGV